MRIYELVAADTREVVAHVASADLAIECLKITWSAYLGVKVTYADIITIWVDRANFPRLEYKLFALDLITEPQHL